MVFLLTVIPAPSSAFSATLPVRPRARHVEQEDVVVGAARDDAEAAPASPAARRTGVGHDLRLVGAELLGLGASRKATALAAMTCISGPPWMPGKTARSISLANSCLHSTMPARGPRRVLWVVVVTKWQCGTGEGWMPAATSPAMWAMSAISRAPASSAIARKRAKSITRL